MGNILQIAFWNMFHWIIIFILVFFLQFLFWLKFHTDIDVCPKGPSDNESAMVDVLAKNQAIT